MKKVFILFLSVLMLLNITSVGQASPKNSTHRITDYYGHWAENTITQWISDGLIEGNADGTFAPNRDVSKAEFITLVNRVFGYYVKAEHNYSDIADGKWYTNDCKIAKANGYMNWYHEKELRPKDSMLREEVFAILATIMQLAPSEDLSGIKKFSDYNQISDWAVDYVDALINSGYIEGNGNGTVEPKDTITRAEAVVMLDRVMGQLINESGTYGSEENAQIIKGNMTVNTSDVILKNMTIEGDLILAAGIADSNVDLKSVTVKGRTLIHGGGENSIHITGSNLGKIRVYKLDGKIRVVLANSEAESLILQSGGEIEGEYADTEIIIDTEEGEEVILDGNFESVIVDSDVDMCITEGSSVANLELAEEAAGSKIEVEGSASIEVITLNCETEVTGTGRINKANVNANGIKIEQQVNYLQLGDGIDGSGLYTTPTYTRQEIVRDVNSVTQDPDKTGGNQKYTFDPSTKTLTISPKDPVVDVPYIDTSRGFLTSNGCWIGVAIKAPVGFTGDIQSLSVDGDTCSQPILSQTEQDSGEFWFYFKAEDVNVSHTLVIEWSSIYQIEIITIQTIGLSLEDSGSHVLKTINNSVDYDEMKVILEDYASSIGLDISDSSDYNSLSEKRKVEIAKYVFEQMTTGYENLTAVVDNFNTALNEQKLIADTLSNINNASNPADTLTVLETAISCVTTERLDKLQLTEKYLAQTVLTEWESLDYDKKLVVAEYIFNNKRAGYISGTLVATLFVKGLFTANISLSGILESGQPGDITINISDVANIPDNKTLKFVFNGGTNLANQTINYCIGNGIPQSFTTDANGIGYFGPINGFTLLEMSDLTTESGLNITFDITSSDGFYLSLGLSQVNDDGSLSTLLFDYAFINVLPDLSSTNDFGIMLEDVRHCPSELTTSIVYKENYSGTLYDYINANSSYIVLPCSKGYYLEFHDFDWSLADTFYIGIETDDFLYYYELNQSDRGKIIRLDTEGFEPLEVIIDGDSNKNIQDIELYFIDEENNNKLRFRVDEGIKVPSNVPYLITVNAEDDNNVYRLIKNNYLANGSIEFSGADMTLLDLNAITMNNTSNENFVLTYFYSYLESFNTFVGNMLHINEKKHIYISNFLYSTLQFYYVTDDNSGYYYYVHDHNATVPKPISFDTDLKVVCYIIGGDLNHYYPGDSLSNLNFYLADGQDNYVYNPRIGGTVTITNNDTGDTTIQTVNSIINFRNITLPSQSGEYDIQFSASNSTIPINPLSITVVIQDP